MAVSILEKGKETIIIDSEDETEENRDGRSMANVVEYINLVDDEEEVHEYIIVPDTDEEDLTEEEDRCSICLAPNAEAPRVRIPCQHVFHSTCLMNWLHIRGGCPICRQYVRDDELVFE